VGIHPIGIMSLHPSSKNRKQSGFTVLSWRNYGKPVLFITTTFTGPVLVRLGICFQHISVVGDALFMVFDCILEVNNQVVQYCC